MEESRKGYNEFRTKMNKRILESGNLGIKRFFNLDASAYKDGILSAKIKEMLGLTASMVLRCDDCIKYHIERCCDKGVTRDEFFEAFEVALVVGGSIVMPHLRRAVAFLDEIES